MFAGTPPLDGSLREYMAFRSEFLFPLPPQFTAEEGALLEPLAVALHTWDLAEFRVAETVAILGCGPIGLLLVQLARLAGAAQVLAVDPLAYRRNMAAAWGAIPLAAAEDLTPCAAEFTGGHGVDVAIEVAGTLPAQSNAAQMVKRGGTVLFVGIPAEDRLELSHHLIRRKGLTLKIVRRQKHAYPRSIELVRSGRIDVASLVTHRFPLERGAEAFSIVEQYADGVVKAVITP